MVISAPPLLATASFSVAGGSASFVTENVGAELFPVAASQTTAVSLLCESLFLMPSGKLIEKARPPADASVGLSAFAAQARARAAAKEPPK
jgi:hypothetical protein